MILYLCPVKQWCITGPWPQNWTNLTGSGLLKKNNIYEGGTNADHCPSDLRGAKYATTKILLKKGELHSWDQGFDANGKQVWGATNGGYIFIKK